LRAHVIWSDPDWYLAKTTNFALPIKPSELPSQDNTSKSTLYLRFTVDPTTDLAAKQISNFEAGVVFSGTDGFNLGVGTAWNSWGYSAFNAAETGLANGFPGEYDLNSKEAITAGLSGFEPPRYGVPRTLVVRVQYVPGEFDHVTVWLEPDLKAGASELLIPKEQTTSFRADASFDRILLLHRGVGSGWRFGNVAIATSFRDLTEKHFWENPQSWTFALRLILGMGLALGLWKAQAKANRLQRERDALAAQNALENERKRIARDLHDELGASLSEISLLSSLAQSSTNPLKELQRIENRTIRSVEALEVIVWSVDPKADTVRNFVDHASQFATNFLSCAQLRLEVVPPSTVMAGTLQATARYNLYLALKEALHNIVKHARAHSVQIRFDLKPEELTLTVSDDGCGLPQNDPALASDGSQNHGLRNMRFRLEQAGGSVQIESTPGHGTTLRFRVPVQP
jgi:signal transduction histidine kinase